MPTEPTDKECSDNPGYQCLLSKDCDTQAPFLKKDDKDYLEFQLKEALKSAKGMPVVFAMVECVKEFVKGKTPSSQETNTVLPDLNEADD